MAWVDGTYLNNMIGSTTVTALGLSSDVLTQYEAAARATVIAVMQFAGYASPGATVDTSTTSGAFLARLCAAVMVRDAYGHRKGITLPPSVQDGLDMLDAIYAKKLPIPGLDPDTRDGYGGIKVAPSTGSTARPTRFGRGNLSGF